MGTAAGSRPIERAAVREHRAPPLHGHLGGGSGAREDGEHDDDHADDDNNNSVSL